MGDTILDRFRPLKWYWLGLALVGLSLFFDPTSIYRVYRYLSVEPKVILTTTGFDSPGNLTYLLSMGLLTALFGRILLATFWEVRNSATVWKIVGSYWAGYLGLVGVFRIFSLLIRPMYASWVTIAFGVLSILLFSYRRLRQDEAAKQLISLPSLNWLWILFAVFFVFVFQVYWGDFFWTGHGPAQYQWLTTKILRSPEFTSIPIVTQHFDEVLFTTFLMGPINFTYEPIMATCLTMAFMKVSVAVFFFQGFRAAGALPFLAFSGATFLMFGSFGLNPFKYHLYFDSAAPLFFVAHTTRVVGFPIFLLLIVGLLRLAVSTAPPWRWSSLVLMSMALTATSLSNSFWAFAILSMGFVFVALSSSRKFDPSRFIWLTFIATILVFAGPVVGYNPAFLWPDPVLPSGSPFVLTAIGGFILIWIWVGRLIDGTTFSRVSKAAKGCLPFIVGSAVGLIFLANILAGNKLNVAVLSFVREIFGVDTITIWNPFPAMTAPRTDVGGTFFVDARARGDWVEYSGSSLQFIFHYATFFLLMLVTHLRLRARPAVSIQEKFLFLMMLGAFFFLCSFFFYTDFVNDMQIGWVKTRFFEGPVYTILMLFVVFLAWETDARLRRFFCWLALTWSIVPFIATERLDQWIANWHVLRDLLQ